MATVSIFFDSRNLPDDRVSVKYLVTHNRKQRLFSTGIIVSSQEANFLKQYAGGLKGHVKDEGRRRLWYRVYEDILRRGKSILEALGDNFTFENFKLALKNNISTTPQQEAPDDIFSWFDVQIQKNDSEGRLGNKEAFQAAKSSIVRYAKYAGYGKKIPFSSITVDFLKGYERWMLKYGKLDGRREKESPASKTTIGVYLRALRTIYNLQKFTEPEQYPFTKKGYQIPKGSKKKKAISSEEIDLILSFCPENHFGTKLLHSTQLAYDLWVFIYFSNGINVADLLKLKKSMISNGKITFIRQKTANTTVDSQSEVTIYLLPRSESILQRWKNTGKGESIWSFLDGVDLDDINVMSRITKNYVKLINKYMKMIGEILGISTPIRTYEARHSFATTLARSEVPLLFISQALGHRSIKTTQDYLGSFEDDQARVYLERLQVRKE